MLRASKLGCRVGRTLRTRVGTTKGMFMNNVMRRWMSSLRIMFGSQTGTAQYFAEQMSQDMADTGATTKVVDQKEVKGLDGLRCGEPLVFLNACYGQGEPTDNARALYQWLMDPTRDTEGKPLEGVPFAIFGLGSSKTHAKYYNIVGRTLDKRLEQLGGVRMFPLGEGDDSECIEEDFEEWTGRFHDFWKEEGDKWSEAAQKAAGQAAGGGKGGAGVEVKGNARVESGKQQQKVAKDPHESIDYDTAAELSQADSEGPTGRPYPLAIIGNHMITRQRLRPCFEMRLRRTDVAVMDQSEPLWYTTGDHLIVYPHNREPARRLALRLGRHPDDAFDWSLMGAARTCDVPEPTGYESVTRSVPGSVIPEALRSAVPQPGLDTVERVLSRMVEFAAPPSPRALRMLADYARDGSEGDRLRALSEKGAYSAYTRQSLRNIADVLCEFPSVHISPEDLLPLLPRLKPRCYSISSAAPLYGPQGEVHISYRRVLAPTPRETLYEGLCSTWLSRLAPSNPLLVAAGEAAPTQLVYGAIRTSHFRMPADISKPIIMVAGGIGIAPFKAFMEERYVLAQKHGIAALGRAFLFRGFRTEEDTMYDELIQASLEAGTLSGDVLALDHPNDPARHPPRMVHQAMLEQTKLIHRVLEDGGNIYVCGGATGFGKAVAAAVMEAMVKHGGYTQSAAQEQLEDMLSTQRYNEDLAD